MFPRRLVTASLLAVSSLLGACSGTSSSSGPTATVTLALAAGTPRTVSVGSAALPVTVRAGNVSADGATSTPLTGTVTLSLSPSDAAYGSIDAMTVTLDATGIGTFNYVPCALTDGSCKSTGAVSLSGTLTVSGKDVTSNTLRLTLAPGPDAGPTTDGGGGTDAGTTDAGTPDAGSVDCTTDTACGLAACDGKACGTDGICVFQSASCQFGGLRVLAQDKEHTPISLSALPAGAPKVTLFAEGLGGKKLFSYDTVTFSVASGSIGSFTTATAHPGAGGIAQVDFVPGAFPASGSITVTVTYGVDPSDGGAPDRGTAPTTTLPVSVVIAGSFAFSPAMGDAYFPVMGVASSGYQETSVLRFALVNSSGSPIPGALVRFSVPALGGAQLSPQQAVTDSNGQAVTTLHSGRIPGTLVVSATATLPSGSTFTADSATIVVVGAKASARNFSVQCDAKALSALVGADCELMHADLSTTCTAVLADRFNNTLGRSVQLTWMSESGFFGPPSQTPSAVPGADPTSQANLGRSANTLKTFASRPPHNVYGDTLSPPLQLLPGENPVQVTDACGTHKNGPRNGLNTFIVVTQGEEAFVDVNGNGVHDSTEPFTDLGEPYLDQNDNNQRDPGEPFMDMNGNGTYDPGNGQWDSTTTIWTEGHIAFTGAPRVEYDNANNLVEPAITRLTPLVDPQALEFNKTVKFGVRWEDENGNIPAPLFTSYSSALLFGTGTALGSVTQTSVTTLPDQFGSLSISNNSSCSGLACTNVKTLSLDGSAQQVVVYRSPTELLAPSGFDDFVNFTASLSDVPYTISAPAVELRNATCNASAIDCSNPACGGQSCTINGSSGTCDVQSLRCVPGQQSSGGYVLTVTVTGSDGTPSSLRLTAPAQPLTVTAILSKNGSVPVGSPTISFSAPSTLGTLKETANASNSGNAIVVTTDATGAAKVTLTPQNDNAATGDLVVTFSEPGGNTIVVQKVITIVVPGTLSFTPAGPDGFTTVMGVKGSDFQEQNILRFTLVDSAGQPYTGAAKVRFVLPGQTVLPNGTIQGTGLGGAVLVPTDINTDSNGEAVTTLYSGTASGTIAVHATASVTLSPGHVVSVAVPSASIAIVGAKANSRNFSVSCDYLALPALIGNDCSFMHADMTLKCTAVIGDRYNNVLGISQPVTWLSEAGLFGPPSTTPAAIPGSDPTTQPSLGRTSNTLRTLNAPMPGTPGALPTTVPPASGNSVEPTFTIANDSCTGSSRVARPRDGLVTLIAVTQGEEGFVDQNGNGQWDPGENFYDLGEPYVDSNDNNQFDIGEPFVDVNGSGSYDGPNGVWDSNTTVWAVQHVAFTGLATTTTWYYAATGTVWNENDPTPTVTTDTVARTVTYSPASAWTGSILSFGVLWQDENGNEPAPQFDNYSVSLASPSSGNTALVSPTTSTSHYIDQWGSMVVRAPTTCVASPVPNVCTSANPKCQCAINTKIIFNQGRPMFGNYLAPAVTGGFDTVTSGLDIDYSGSNGSALSVAQGTTRGVLIKSVP
jgi:hypothetical protein